MDDNDRCLRCNACTTICPIVRIVGADAFPGPRFFVNILRNPHAPEVAATRDALRLCTSCGRCAEVCPNDVDACPIELRGLLFDAAQAAPGYQQLLDTLARTGFSVDGAVPPDLRGSGGSGRPPDVLVFPGCIAGIRLPDIARATLTLLERLDVSYAIPDGWHCCGSPAAKLGARDVKHELSGRTLEAFAAVGAREHVVVTPCPGCASHLRCMAGEYEVYHTVEYLAEVMGLETLEAHIGTNAAAQRNPQIAVHYPCHLVHGDNPWAKRDMRRLAALVAPPLDTEDCCCGAGGGVLSGASNVAKALRERKLTALDKVERLVTACPFCVLNLRQAATDLGLTVRIGDLTELFMERRDTK